jgi:hypothetical protein
MIEIFKEPLTVDKDMTIRWDAFEKEFLSLYQDVCYERGNVQQKAAAIIDLCRAAIGGFAGQKDLCSAKKVIEYYTPRASIIHNAGKFKDVDDFDIVCYKSEEEKKRLQSVVLPKITLRLRRPVEIDRAPERKVAAVSATLAGDSSTQSSHSHLHLLRRCFLDTIRTLSRTISSSFLARRTDHSTFLSMGIGRLFGNLGKEPSDFASRSNRKRTRRLMNSKTKSQERDSQRQDAQ